MKQKILKFSPANLSAIAEGRKTQTRRIVRRGVSYTLEEVLLVTDGESSIPIQVTALSQERLRNIWGSDVFCEGISFVKSLTRTDYYYPGNPHSFGNGRAAFFALWDSIHGACAAEKNPIVWVITFTVKKGT